MGKNAHKKGSRRAKTVLGSIWTPNKQMVFIESFIESCGAFGRLMERLECFGEFWSFSESRGVGKLFLCF